MLITNTRNVFMVSLLATLLTACTNSGTPNPDSGKQTGAVVGALAGSAIGYNKHGKYNRGTTAIVGGLLGAAVGTGVGSIVDSNNPQPVKTGGWQ